MNFNELTDDDLLDRRKGCTPVSFFDWQDERRKQKYQLTTK